MIKVYSLPNCVQCDKTVKVLESKNIKFEKIDLSKNPESLDFVKSLGYYSAPVVVVGDDTHWSGFQIDKLESL